MVPAWMSAIIKASMDEWSYAVHLKDGRKYAFNRCELNNEYFVIENDFESGWQDRYTEAGYQCPSRLAIHYSEVVSAIDSFCKNDYRYGSEPLEKSDWQHCYVCKVDQPFYAVTKRDSLGRIVESGSCDTCGRGRLLPLTEDNPGEFQFYFGKHKNKKIKEIPKDYLIWCVENINTEQHDKLISRIKSYLQSAP